MIFAVSIGRGKLKLPLVLIISAFESYDIILPPYSISKEQTGLCEIVTGLFLVIKNVSISKLVSLIEGF